MNYEVIKDIEPKLVWKYFSDLTELPRPSKKEEKVISYLKDFSVQHNLDFKVDEVGNVYIYKEGNRGIENDRPLIIQNHIDMVTDHRSDPHYDFSNNPIKIKKDKDGAFITAVDTTLGADNGIGVASALAILASEEIKHPPLECLFTVDEETGLNGAINIKPEYFKGKRLLNLDTEEWGSFYIGCAGGANIDLIRKFELSAKENLTNKYVLRLDGLSGGHSGIEIHKQKGNAIFLLSYFLKSLVEKFDIQISSIEGGRAHNIIPNWATANIAASSDVTNDIYEQFTSFKREVVGILPEEDREIYLSIQNIEKELKVFDKNNSLELLEVLSLLPHGVNGYDINTNYEVVSSSLNTAKIAMNDEGYVGILCSLRFFNVIEKDMILSKINAIASRYDFQVEVSSGYPSWKPNSQSEILEKAKKVYQEMFREEPKVTAIHAGLECGILLEKIGDIESLSLGPNIYGAHTVDERVEIKSVEVYWNYLTELLKII